MFRSWIYPQCSVMQVQAITKLANHMVGKTSNNSLLDVLWFSMKDKGSAYGLRIVGAHWGMTDLCNWWAQRALCKKPSWINIHDIPLNLITISKQVERPITVILPATISISSALSANLTKFYFLLLKSLSCFIFSLAPFFFSLLSSFYLLLLSLHNCSC